MKPIHKNTLKRNQGAPWRWPLVVAMGIFAFFVVSACLKVYAGPRELPASQLVPCGILEEFAGEVQILDATRTEMIETHQKVPIPCGAWISIQTGWAHVKHRQGFSFEAASDTFFQIFDRDSETIMSNPEQVVVQKGRLYFDVANGEGELQVLTAGARVRVPHGRAFVFVNPAHQETELVQIAETGSIENRFAPEPRVMVRAGELSVMSLNALRVIPSAPAAINTSPDPKDKTSLKMATVEFKYVNAKDFKRMTHVLADRKEEQYGNIKLKRRRGEAPDAAQDRMPASEEQNKKLEGDPSSVDAKVEGKVEKYSSIEKEMEPDETPTQHASRMKAHQKNVSRLTGGASDPESLLYPVDQTNREPARVNEEESGESRVSKKIRKEREAEKKKVVDELSQLRIGQ